MSRQMAHADAVAFFAEFYGGEHHFPHKIREYGSGWSMLHRSGLATYDFDQLTRLVFMAHDRCIRVEVSIVNMQWLRIAIHQRRPGEGQMYEVHPTLDEALAAWREHNPLPTTDRAQG